MSRTARSVVSNKEKRRIQFLTRLQYFSERLRHHLALITSLSVNPTSLLEALAMGRGCQGLLRHPAANVTSQYHTTFSIEAEDESVRNG